LILNRTYWFYFSSICYK